MDLCNTHTRGLYLHSSRYKLITPTLFPESLILPLPGEGKGGEMRDTGNQVVTTLDFSNQLGVKGGIPNFK